MKVPEYKIKDIIKKDEGSYELTMNYGQNGYNLCEASWKDVPRYHKDGRLKTPEEFKAEEIAKNGSTHFQQNFGNCVGYNTFVDIEDIGEIKIGELYDSL